MLIAAKGLTALPNTFFSWVEHYNQQGHKFLVGDLKMSDDILHRALSSLGALENTTLYALGSVGSNRYGIKERLYKYEYDNDSKILHIEAESDPTDVTELSIKKEMDIELTEQFYEFKDRKLVKDCDMGIFVVSGEIPKRLDKMITFMNIYNKPVYVLNA